jgi:hypothetical protein
VHLFQLYPQLHAKLATNMSHATPKEDAHGKRSDAQQQGEEEA